MQVLIVRSSLMGFWYYVILIGLLVALLIVWRVVKGRQ